MYVRFAVVIGVTAVQIDSANHTITHDERGAQPAIDVGRRFCPLPDRRVARVRNDHRLQRISHDLEGVDGDFIILNGKSRVIVCVAATAQRPVLPSAFIFDENTGAIIPNRLLHDLQEALQKVIQVQTAPHCQGQAEEIFHLAGMHGHHFF